MRKNFGKRTVNGVNARIEAIVKKYGFECFRSLANKYINSIKSKNKLVKEIAFKEKELESLKLKG